jgi:hypothetical protein
MSKDAWTGVGIILMAMICGATISQAAGQVWATGASPRPTNYRATLYDGGQVISAWICHDYGSDGEGVRLTLREGGTVWVRGTLIIEEVPARTEVR